MRRLSLQRFVVTAQLKHNFMPRSPFRMLQAVSYLGKRQGNGEMASFSEDVYLNSFLLSFSRL